MLNVIQKLNWFHNINLDEEDVFVIVTGIHFIKRN